VDAGGWIRWQGLHNGPMPHIILETTADLQENAQVPDILEALIAKLVSFETIDPKAVKAYHALRSVWRHGEGGQPGFAHCTVGILQGRPVELRKRIADEMYVELQSHFPEALATNEVNITLELREFDADTYRK
jgi:5-carboxymethyl-2-hydroxymuconate isomerase